MVDMLNSCRISPSWTFFYSSPVVYARNPSKKNRIKLLTTDPTKAYFYFNTFLQKTQGG